MRSDILHCSFPSKKYLFLSRGKNFKQCFKIKVLTFLLLSEEPRIFSPDTQDPSKHQTKQMSVNAVQSSKQPNRKMRPQRQLEMHVCALLCPCIGLARDQPACSEVLQLSSADNSTAPGEKVSQHKLSMLTSLGNEPDWKHTQAFLSGASVFMAVCTLASPHTTSSSLVLQKPGPFCVCFYLPLSRAGAAIKQLGVEGTEDVLNFPLSSLALTAPAPQHQRKAAAHGGLAHKGKLNHSTRLPEHAVPACVVAPSTRNIP